MEIIIISSPQKINNESLIINSLFEKGLNFFHLRKPDFTEDDYISLLAQINTNFHDRIILSHHQSLIYKFNLKGIHFTERERNKKKHLFFEDLNCIKTTSFHSIQDIKTNTYNWDYYFLSPFYDSISKKKYPSGNFDLKNINIDKIVPLGGINDKNILTLKEIGFKKCGLLGHIWNQYANND